MTWVKGISIGKLLIGALVIFMTLNTIGFCYSKFNFNTRGMLIDIAIRDTILEDRQLVPNTINTVEEFRAAYPNCCETHSANGALGLIAMLFFGAGSTDVYVWFEATKDSKSYSYNGVYNIDCRGINSKRRDVETQAAGSKSNVIDALQSQQSEETDLAEQVGQRSLLRPAKAGRLSKRSLPTMRSGRVTPAGRWISLKSNSSRQASAGSR